MTDFNERNYLTKILQDDLNEFADDWANPTINLYWNNETNKYFVNISHSHENSIFHTDIEDWFTTRWSEVTGDNPRNFYLNIFPVTILA